MQDPSGLWRTSTASAQSQAPPNLNRQCAITVVTAGPRQVEMPPRTTALACWFPVRLVLWSLCPGSLVLWSLARPLILWSVGPLQDVLRVIWKFTGHTPCGAL